MKGFLAGIPAAAIALLACGCGRSTQSPAASTAHRPAAPDPWVLTETNPHATTPALLSNGLVGVRLSRAGSGSNMNGDPLPSYLIDEYETSGEEKIRSLPNVLCWVATIDGRRLDPTFGSRYEQSLDTRTGVLGTAWAQPEASVDSRAALDPQKRLASLTVALRADPGKKVRIDWFVAGGSGQRGSLRPFPSPILLSNSGTTAWVRPEVQGIERPSRSDIPGGWRWEGTVGSGGTVSLSVLAGWSAGALSRSQSVAITNPAGAQEAHMLSGGSVPSRCDGVEAVSKARWSSPDAPDIEIEGPVEDQQAVRSFLHYLRSGINPESTFSSSPLGLSGQTYNGHVFWDADLWVFPALALLEPRSAARIPEYRWTTREAWKKNFDQARASRQDTSWGEDPPTPLYRAAARGGALIGMTPWESSVSGLEVAPGSSRQQHHITGTAAFAASMASDLGLMDRPKAESLVDNAARFFAARAHLRPDKTYGIRGVMSPDEFHIGDNDLFTNLLAQWCLDRSRYGREVKPRFHLPADGETFLTYDSDALRTYKQAAAVLSIYPLQYAPAEKQAAKMMERFADKVTKNGPAMSNSIHATIWARLGQREKAYEAWRRSWQDFTNHPLMLFSEKRSKDVTYFSTGAAGCLQTVLYGFAGIRLDDAKNPRAAWSIPVRNGRWLNVVPQLPPSWKSVNLKNVSVLGKRYNLMVTSDSVRATEGDS